MTRHFSRLRRLFGALIPHRADWRAMGRGGVLGVLLSALLMTLAFPRADLGGLVWFALVPVLFVTRDKPVRAAKWLWYLFGCAWIYASVCWFNVTMYVNPLVLGGIVLMAMILALWILLFGWATWWLRRLGPAHLLFAPMLWVALEYSHLFGDLAFPWLFLAHTQWDEPAMIQSASVFGAWGLSFLIITINALLAEALWLARRRRPAREWTPVVAGALVWTALMAANLVLGQRAVARWDAPPSERSLRLAIVQPAWPQRDKLTVESDGEHAGEVERRLRRSLSDQLAAIEPGTVDLAILPESVIMDFAFPLSGEEQMDDLAEEARRLRAAVLFGANNTGVRPGIDPNAAQIWVSDLLLRNSVWALDPEGRVSGVYDKVALVPFAETAPLLTWIPGLMRITLGNIGLFTAGESLRPITALTPRGNVAVGAHVCFESTFPNVVAGQVREGAQLLATVTNDGWFLDSAGPMQHWIVQPFRAVENRRWIAQSANTGYSSLVNPAGIAVGRTQLDEPAILQLEADPLTEITFYTRHGDWLAQLFAGLALAGTVWARWRRRPPLSTEPGSPLA